MLRNTLTASLLLTAALGTAQAGVINVVSLDTSGLIGQGTYYADFQFTSPNGNNTVTLSQLNFNPGSSYVLPSQPGAFFSEVLVPFTPGPLLTFRMEFETNPLVVKFPDQFSFYLSDAQQNALETADPLGTNALVLVNLTANGPAVTAFEGSGEALQSTPAVTSAVPEPALSVVLGLSLAGIGAVRSRARRRSGRDG